VARAGDDNTATVTGDDSRAIAGYGDGNTATVTGDGSQAQAVVQGCTVEMTGDGQTESCP
jgi:hypothetical protein